MSSLADRNRLRARIYPLGGEPGDDLSASTTVAERLQMVAVLSAEAWALSGRPLPTYQRHEIPIAIVPLICNTRASGRAKDLADLDALGEANEK